MGKLYNKVSSAINKIKFNTYPQISTALITMPQTTNTSSRCMQTKPNKSSAECDFLECRKQKDNIPHTLKKISTDNAVTLGKTPTEIEVAQIMQKIDKYCTNIEKIVTDKKFKKNFKKW